MSRPIQTPCQRRVTERRFAAQPPLLGLLGGRKRGSEAAPCPPTGETRVWGGQSQRLPPLAVGAAAPEQPLPPSPRPRAGDANGC